MDPLSPKLLAERGYCCGNGCANCPFSPRHITDNLELDEEFGRFWEENPDTVFSFEEYSKSQT